VKSEIKKGALDFLQALPTALAKHPGHEKTSADDVEVNDAV